MRHIFDQYSQPENQITHALVSCLAQDQKLLRQFIKWSIGETFPLKEKLYITEQSLPGELESEEKEAEKKGLPDAWIYTDNGWSLLVESKVAASLTVGQLKRHISTAKRRGFNNIKVLAITAVSVTKKLPKGTFLRNWSEIYEWANKNTKKSKWASLFTSYLEVAEAKMIQKEYLKDGKLTKFTGIKFDNDNPYTYLEAKRLLKLLADELIKDRSFVKKMDIDIDKSLRGAIKGKKSKSVWNYLVFKSFTKGISKEKMDFTDFPHLTIGISDTQTGYALTIPHKSKSVYRNRLLGKDFFEFRDNLFLFKENIEKVLKVDDTIKPIIQAHQRHYPTRSSKSIQDAMLYFDMRTAENSKDNKEKYQPQYLRTVYEIMKHKKANIQFQVGVRIFYDRSKAINNAKAITLIKESFIALRPLIRKLR